MNPLRNHRVTLVAAAAASILASVAATPASAAPASRPGAALRPPAVSPPSAHLRRHHGRSLQSTAAWGTIGEYTGANGACVNHRVRVAAPLLHAARVDFGNLIGAQNNQWVAWRAWVYRAESAQWTPGPWLAQQVITDGFTLGATPWLNLDTRQLQGGVSEFDINGPGTYSVYVQYYWYANQYVGAGGDGEFLYLANDDAGPLPIYGTTCRYSS